MGEVRESSNEGDELMEVVGEVATIPIRFESIVGLIYENLTKWYETGKIQYSMI